MVKVVLMGLLTSTNVIWGGTVGHAEEPNQAFTLDPMVVTAQRMETRDLDTPAAVTVIPSEEMPMSMLSLKSRLKGNIMKVCKMH